MDAAVSLLSLFSILLGLSVSASAEVCFWSGSCTNKWVSGCGAGRVKVDQSDDCHGLCPPPRYPPCPLFATHYLCCNEETPIATDECARYPTRVEVGDHWMCCSDGSRAEVTKHDVKTGFCRSGAQLMIQRQEREVFKWVPREWSACSASCGEEGFRSRLIHCVGRLEHSAKQLYYVNETKCDSSSMPHHQEPCRAKSCSYEHDLHYREKHYRRKHKLHLWAKLIIFFLTSIGTAGLSVGGYILYQRWKERNANHGCVYVMLDNYS
ncbi:unnamed protein product [Calypogeia fissa]